MRIQWHRVFDDALRSSDVVAVARTAAAYLGREPTRSELTAARRAANSHAEVSNSQVLHARGSQNGRAVHVLLLARPTPTSRTPTGVLIA